MFNSHLTSVECSHSVPIRRDVNGETNGIIFERVADLSLSLPIRASESQNSATFVARSPRTTCPLPRQGTLWRDVTRRGRSSVTYRLTGSICDEVALGLNLKVTTWPASVTHV